MGKNIIIIISISKLTAEMFSSEEGTKPACLSNCIQNNSYYSHRFPVLRVLIMDARSFHALAAILD